MDGCGCKICKSGLGEFTNELANRGVSVNDISLELKSQDLEVTHTIIKKHLTAYDIPYTEELRELEIEGLTPVTVELNQIDFSQYQFDENNPDEIISYLQKINLKLYLNQARITLQRQQDVIEGRLSEVPLETVRALESLYKILEKSTAIDVQVNQQKAIKEVEALGLVVQKPAYFLPASNQNNVQSNSQPKTN
ncbi:MAG: hypothetical protein AAF208_06705 [Cyanobacteria bacterium P01_A01_bin.45]